MRIKLDQILNDFFYAIKITLSFVLTYYKLFIFIGLFTLAFATFTMDSKITVSGVLFVFCFILFYLPLILIYKILDKKYPDYKELDIEKKKERKRF
jgi:amino acid permease